eukprot:TRINITY_DN2529_c0_g1_i1.p1 TRINITY_DN2529_c0_g1~~TRINITY_DN2529_c0_g1_i1.p1  ORF type:complete len:107 (-),score=17.68 TRINITY_DN2529_c0_g1_i1:101-421(-)
MVILVRPSNCKCADCDYEQHSKLLISPPFCSGLAFPSSHHGTARNRSSSPHRQASNRAAAPAPSPQGLSLYPCLLYTSDAADEEDSVDLGGRRIIKKKKKNEIDTI